MKQNIIILTLILSGCGGGMLYDVQPTDTASSYNPPAASQPPAVASAPVAPPSTVLQTRQNYLSKATEK